MGTGYNSLDLRRLLGFERLAGTVDGPIDFRDPTIAAQLGAELDLCPDLRRERRSLPGVGHR